MRFRFCNILPAIFISIISPAWASSPPPALDFKGVYEFGTTGLTLGKMGVEIEQTGTHYAITSDITLSGLAKLFVQHTSHSEVEASGYNFAYPNVIYETHYQTKKKKKNVKLVYKSGVITEETLLPPDPKRPKIPADLKNKATDPLSFILRIREALMLAQEKKEKGFSLNVYDGRRLTEANFTLLNEPRTILYKGKKTPVITASIRRKPLGGFTPSELADADPKEAPLIVYFSKDERLIPLKFEATAWFGVLTAILAKECRTGESCLLGLKE